MMNDHISRIIIKKIEELRKVSFTFHRYMHAQSMTRLSEPEEDVYLSVRKGLHTTNEITNISSVIGVTKRKRASVGEREG